MAEQTKDATNSYIETYKFDNPDGTKNEDMFDLEVHWSPAVKNKFPNELFDIVKCIIREHRQLMDQGAGLEIWQHMFTYRDTQVLVAITYDEERNTLMFFPDLVSDWRVLVGSDGENGDEEVTVLHPKPVTRADALH